MKFLLKARNMLLVTGLSTLTAQQAAAGYNAGVRRIAAPFAERDISLDVTV